MSYLTDIFNLLNSLNLSTQGGYPSILEVNHCLHENSAMLPHQNEIIHTNNLSVAIVREVVPSQLTALSRHFRSYVPDVNTNAWECVRDSYPPAATSGLTDKAEEELLD